MMGSALDASGLSRQQLRQTLRLKRNGLSSVEQNLASDKLAQSLLELTKKGDTIALYFGNDGELSPNKAIFKLLEEGRKVVVPVMHGFRKGYLNFQLYDTNTQMKTNHFGIEEPILSAEQTVALAGIDYLFMPLVGFDDKGNRLGMGGGFYDRTLSRIHNLETRPKLIGLAHDCQQVQVLPVQSWDVPIDMIITPSKKIMPSRNY